MTAGNIIQDLLDLEESLFLSGDWSGLSDLADQKEKVLREHSLAIENFNEDVYAEILTKARRNEMLILAAQRGVLNASRTIQGARACDNSQAYSRGGRKFSLSTTPISLKKRV